MKKDRLPIVTAWVVAIFLGAAGLWGQVWGGTYYHHIREAFDGSESDSVRVDHWVGADSSGSFRLTMVAGDSVGMDSIQDSVLVNDSATNILRYKGYFFGLSDVLCWTEIIPPMFPAFSGGVGTGSYTVDWYVIDTLAGATNLVDGALVTVKDWALSTTPIATPITDAGIARLQTNNDSTAAIVTAPLYIFPLTWDSIKYTTDTSDTIYGYLNVPAAAATVQYVRVYLDVGTGEVDSTSGAMIPRERIEYTLSTVGQPNLRMTDGSWAIIPEDQVKRPNSSGRVTFVVPGNTAMTPSGSWYELRYRSKDRRSRFSGLAFKFEVDTLVDPISIINCEQVP